MIALFIHFLFASTIPHISNFLIPYFDAGLYLITLTRSGGEIGSLYWVPVTASSLDLF